MVHLGPTAQDFYGAFGLGDDDKSIATIDLDGVSLAAIQGLYELSQEQQARIAALEDRLEGQQDTVIKSIHGPIQNVRGIAGATELGRRGAVLVLDVSALVDELAPRREAAA